MNSWPAPAKINLFLHILGRRDDGYHNLQTAFQFIDYSDALHFDVNDSGKINLQSNYSNVVQNDDLIMRAASMLQEHVGTKSGVDIIIEKKLPMGGGLGGGSSNAATTLVALNHLWGLKLSQDQLASLGLRLGADVPVFVAGKAAWAEGVGEHLQPIEVPEKWYLVVNPGVQVPTAEIFNTADLTRDTPPITIRDFLAGMGHNDCEVVVRNQHPEVSQVIDWMRKYSSAMMTGTGACVFSGFAQKEQARQLYAELPAKWSGFIAKGVNESPLLDRLAEEGP
jgi:4-diphosphocytidyl-2-C-methyl-D-erythritol kinase